MIIIKDVLKKSLAQRSGFKINDKIVRINGNEIRDSIDLSFYSSLSELDIEFERNGKKSIVHLENLDCRSLGLIPEDFKIKQCNNKCIFCFVDQMPKGFRKTLYIKDEDYRLSFLDGAYICATNLSDEDYQRIFTQSLSPLYLSVHATDESIRKRLLGRKAIDPIINVIKRLTERRISIHAQIVVCPQINDGKVLLKTLKELSAFYPMLESIAIVPVGLTKHRSRLPDIKPIDKVFASKMIITIKHFQKILCQKFGRNFVYLADEFYIKAGHPLPRMSHYYDFPQFSNGVGMMRDFINNFEDHLLIKQTLKSSKRIGVITGMSALKYIRTLIAKLGRFTSNKYTVIPVVNNVCGENVTVTGLLCGKDIINTSFKYKDQIDRFLLPPNCLNADGLTLDGYSLKSMKQITKKQFIVVNNLDMFL